MNNRREFLAAGGALAAAIAILPEAKGDQNEGLSLYIHGMVWNQRLPAPMNDWLIRLDAKADIPITNSPGFATLGDDLHDAVGSHVQIQAALLNGSQLTLTGSITESKTAGLVGQPLRIEGKLNDSSVEGLTVSIGGAVFSGAGAVGRRIHEPLVISTPVGT